MLFNHTLHRPAPTNTVTEQMIVQHYENHRFVHLSHGCLHVCCADQLLQHWLEANGLAHERVDDVDAGIERARAMSNKLKLRSPTAVASYKRGLLAALGESSARRLQIESAAYEWTVDAGEAAKGREAFGAIRRGEAPTWGPRSLRDDPAI